MEQLYTKQVTCPEHLTHTATLFTHGHKYAGTWECKSFGVSDVCEHSNGTHQEVVTQDHFGYSGHYQTEAAADVCNDCECTVDTNDEHAFAPVEMDCAA